MADECSYPDLACRCRRCELDFMFNSWPKPPKPRPWWRRLLRLI